MGDEDLDPGSRLSEEGEREEEEEEKLFFIWGEWSQNITTPLKMDFSQPTLIRKIALGSSFAIILDKEGDIWSWGFNEHGCIGQGQNKRVSKIPMKVTMPDGSDDKFEDVVIGENHVLALTTSGVMFAWGDNSFKQIGVGTKEGTKVWTPMKVSFPGDPDIYRAYASLNSSFALSDEGKVYAWGGNGDGQLGLSSLVDIEVPKLIENLPEIGDLILNGKQVIALQKVNLMLDESDAEDAQDFQFNVLPVPKAKEDGLSRGGSVAQPNDFIQPTLDRKQTEVKSVVSQKSARSNHSHRSNRSGRSSISSRAGLRNQPVDKLSKVLKEIIPVIHELNASFKSIDNSIESICSHDPKDKKKGNLAGVIDCIKKVRETMKNDYLSVLSLDPFVDDKENVEIKNFLTVIRDSLLDSLTLRSLNVIIMKMKDFKNELDIYSFINLENSVEKDRKIKLPESTKKYISLFSCARVEKNIKRYSQSFKNLVVGMSSATSSAASFAINSVLEHTQLWAGVNNLTAELSKLHSAELKHKVFCNVMDEVWKAYENITNSNLDKIHAENGFDNKKFKNLQSYIEYVLKTSKNLKDKGKKELEKIKEENNQYFSKHMKAVYHILQENIQLREMLNECQKNMILKNFGTKTSDND